MRVVTWESIPHGLVSIAVAGTAVDALHLAEFNHDGETVQVEAAAESILLFGHAMPFNEPVVAQGPFVMNTGQEIKEAYRDYQQGKFGTWNHA